MSQMSVVEFFREFPDDDVCLEHLMKIRYGLTLKCPKCEVRSTFHRVKKRKTYECQCGHQISPMAGTPFERSSTSLQKWFYAVYLFTTSRHGVPAKELERQLSVTYKTAWRMGHEIRKYMGKIDGTPTLSGHVEVDETYIGGKDGEMGRPNPKTTRKTAILGMVERQGKLQAQVVPDTRRDTLLPLIQQAVEKGTTISTDELNTYKKLTTLGYQHGYVRHNLDQWKKGPHHTNTIENFWGRLKVSIRGTHIHVSKKHMPKYVAEFSYRYNMRGVRASSMFDCLLASF